MNSLGIIIGIIILGFAAYQVYLLIRDIIRRNKNKNKAKNTSDNKVGSTDLEEHKKEVK